MIFTSNKLRWSFAFCLVLLGLWGSKGINLRDDVLDLLPGQAVRTDIKILQRLGLVNRVFISLEIEGENTPIDEQQINKLTHNAEMLGTDLRKSKMFRDVVYRLDEGYEWFTFSKLWNYLPALSGPETLQLLPDKLTPSSIEQSISEDFTQLNSPTGIPLVNQVRRDPLGLITMLFKRLERLKGEFSMTIYNGFFLSKDRKSCLIWAESLTPLTDSVHAQRIQDIIDRSLQQNKVPGIKARIIGTLPHTLANANLVKNDLRKLLPLASICLLAFLLVSLGGLRAILVMIIPLMAAPLAIASLNLIYDGISSIALGFGIVLMGIAVDFSIHLYLALSSENNCIMGLKKVTKPIILGALTTVGVFIVLLFSEVPSHRQMATLAIIGLVVALFLSFLLIPTIIPNKLRLSSIDLPNKIHPPCRRPKWSSVKIFLWIILILIGCWSWTQLHYDGDLRSLDVPNSKVLEDETAFKNTWHHNEAQTLIVAQGDSIEAALKKNDLVYDRLNSLKINNIQSLSLILPSRQKQTENISHWSQFWQKNASKTKNALTQTGEKFSFVPDAFSPFFKWLKHPVEPLQADILLNSPLRPIIISMLRVPAPYHNLQKNSFLVTTIVPDSKGMFPALQRTLGDEKDVTIISNSKWRSQVENLLRHDIIRLSTAAGLLIIIVVSFYFKNILQTFAALAPVFSALSAMSIYGVLTTKELNMMHVLMGIMVIGISVDYGIFMVCSKNTEGNNSTSKAVTICAVSTLIGFGVLALAKHYALSTLGTTVLVGIGAAWPTALFITPVILEAKHGETKWT